MFEIFNEYSGLSFELNIKLNHFLAQFNEKMNIWNILATASRVWGRLVEWTNFFNLFLENFPNTYSAIQLF